MCLPISSFLDQLSKLTGAKFILHHTEKMHKVCFTVWPSIRLLYSFPSQSCVTFLNHEIPSVRVCECECVSVCVHTGKDTTSTSITNMHDSSVSENAMNWFTKSQRRNVRPEFQRDPRDNSRKTQGTCLSNHSPEADVLPDAGTRSEAATGNFLMKKQQHHQRARAPGLQRAPIPCSHHLI